MCGGDDGREIDALVLEELAVLGGEDRVDQGFGDVLVGHGLGVATVVEFGEDLTRVGVDPADPTQVGKRELHRLRVRHPFVLDPLERAVCRVGAEKCEEPHPSGEEQGDRDERGKGAEPSAAPFPRLDLVDQRFSGH